MPPSRPNAPFSEPYWHYGAPPPYYTESHFKLQAETRAYVNEYITPFCEEWERQGSIPREAYERHAKLGYVAAGLFPPEPDYLGEVILPCGIPPDKWDGFHDHIVVDELTRCGYMGVVWALACGNIIGCPPLINHGTTEQKRRLLPSIYNGTTRFCLAVTEPSAGSDVANIKTVAKRQGDKYIVNGTKKWITNGVYADYCTAAVRTGGPGQSGISALIIPLDAKGVTRRRMDNSGINASGSTFIEFDDVGVPIGNLLGKEHEGFGIIMNNFNHERLWLATICLRLARVCVGHAHDYATKRETFGKKLIENQIIRAKLVDSGKKIQAAYAWLEQLIWTRERLANHDGPDTLGASVAMLKTLSARTLEETVREAQQIFGGLGYSKNGRGRVVEQISRDFRVLVVGGGSEEILTDFAYRQEARTLKGYANGTAKL
ncbi:hypothetical protein NCS57_00970300 [Fusarium keratoplasticum]|uniref:Uncharacterized protein n=1 Tax=Fusarium keratoplasticum TaxID=1328300 RepID=A0ACC0QR89_9HYPO|nr:hypothetical protein NCS57_00970300 [Fusarium keratoplasticum]KAI8663686.1 hypothetical protein NCS57_00970300 [Fusarium keratoplasticum]